jgi:hypothetical protein
MWNWVWMGAVLLILAAGFAKYDATRWRLFLSLGAVSFAALAILPPGKRPGEAWTCVAVIVSCALFGFYMFRAGVGKVHPRDRSDYLGLHIGLGILAGITIVLPYVLIRLLRLRSRPSRTKA